MDIKNTIKTEEENSLLLTLFDTNLIQNIFVKLFEKYKYKLKNKSTNPDIDLEEEYQEYQKFCAKQEEVYKKYFSKMNNFGLVCKLLNNISKQTLFNLNIYNIKFKIPYNLNLKLSYIENIVERFNQEKNVDMMLVKSCVNGFYDIIHILIETGNANINAQLNSYDHTPLLGAAGNNKIKTIKELFKYQELNANLFYETPVFLEVCYDNFEEVIELILTRKDADLNWDEDDTGDTGLIMLIRRHQEKLVSLAVLRSDLDINAQNDGGETSLIIAIRENQPNIVSLLLSRNDLDLNLMDGNNLTALIYASWGNQEDIVSLLLSRNDLDINIQDTNFGNTAFIHAAWKNHEKVVSLLLSKNDLNLNIQNNEGYTALIYATVENNENIVSLLLSQKKRININLKDNDQKTALDHAKEKNHETIIKMIQNYEKD